jgi:hypothetical protein
MLGIKGSTSSNNLYPLHFTKNESEVKERNILERIQ